MSLSPECPVSWPVRGPEEAVRGVCSPMAPRLRSFAHLIPPRNPPRSNKGGTLCENGTVAHGPRHAVGVGVPRVVAVFGVAAESRALSLASQTEPRPRFALCSPGVITQ